VTLRSDHVAGGAASALGLAVVAASSDLPVGTLASPGPGMLPMLAAGLILLLGAVLLLGAGASQPFADTQWLDLPHALCVTGVTAAGLLLFERLGFLLTVTGLLLFLLVAVERKPAWTALAFSIGVSIGAYALMGKVLRSPLPIGLVGF
jgi:hypothetical protein